MASSCLPSSNALNELLRSPLTAGPQLDEEKELLDEFLLQHAQRYDFSHREAGAAFGLTFQLLVQQRFLSRPNWEKLQPYSDCRLRVLQCMRVLMRDQTHRTCFVELGAVGSLVALCIELAGEHFSSSAGGEFSSEMLVETLSILKRFAALEELGRAGCMDVNLVD